LFIGFSACYREKPPTAIVPGPEYRKAESFLDRRNDSAFYYFNKVASGSKDSLQIAMAYNQMAAIQSDAGDNFGSQESLLVSLKFLDGQKEKDRKCIASDYNELGMSSYNLKDYDAAIGFYQSALKFSDSGALKAVIINNEANAYQKKKDYAQALKLYRAVIGPMKTNSTAYARILTNMATTRWLQQPHYHAAPDLLKALRIRQKENDFFGENSSYGHLSDYYLLTRPDSALLYAGKMYAVATRINSPEDRLEALQKLITIGKAGTAQQYFLLYQRLSDSLQTARNAAKNQFALIRYDAEKNKADNLKLQRDNADKKYEIAAQRFWLWLTLLTLVAASITAVVWYRKRKQRLEKEAQEAIRESQLKTSKRVHDVVANGLYRIMKEMEFGEQPDKEQILDKIEVLYEQSRDISDEKPTTSPLDFNKTIAGLVKSFGSDHTKVLLAGNSPDIWKEVSGQVKYELEHVLQELMVNMSKHSHAGTAAIKFEREDRRILVNYADDGVGFPKDFKFGNGLRNTGNRIKDIGGDISFSPKATKGVNILISFPIHKDDHV